MLERECIELQQKLTTEVVRAVRNWRSRTPETSLEIQKDTLEEIVKALESARDDGRGKHIINALREDNLLLSSELERLRRLGASESAVRTLQEVQSEIRGLQDRVHRLQEEANEKKAAHTKELQRRLAELRRVLHQREDSTRAVLRAREERQGQRQSPSAGPSPEPTPGVLGDLHVKVDKARLRLQRTQRELEEKRSHPKKLPHSVDSLEKLSAMWAEQVRLLEKLQRRDAERTLMRDRVLMFKRNMEILRKENDALETQLQDVHQQVARFVEDPMTPTALVERNVNLLLHMEKIERTLAEKAVELDKQEKELQLEENKVREALVVVETLRKENRHLNRRLRRAEEMEVEKDKTRQASPVSIEHRPPLGSQTLSMFLLPVSDKELTPSECKGEHETAAEGQPETEERPSVLADPVIRSASSEDASETGDISAINAPSTIELHGLVLARPHAQLDQTPSAHTPRDTRRST